MTSRRRTVSANLASRLGGGLVLVLLATVAIAAIPQPAWADSVQSQIDRANQKLEPIIEKYDEVAGELSTDQAKAATLGADVERASSKVSAAQAKLKPVVASVYEFGPVETLGLLLDSTTTVSLVNRLGTSEELARRQRAVVTSLVTARDRYRAAKKSLDATVKKLSSRKADLAAKKKTILTQIAALEKLQHKLPTNEAHSSDALRPVPCPYTPIGGAAGIAVRTACAQIGKPYVWAAVGPRTFDCSGLMVYAWAAAGRHLRHFTRWQWDDGTPITRSQLRPGDLVFFFPPTLHHVGMYVGGGWMVNAPHTGDVVRMARIDTLPIGGYRRV